MVPERWAQPSGSRWVRRSLALVTAVLLVSGGGAAYTRQRSQVVSVDEAVRRYRDASTAPADTTPGATAAETAPATTAAPATASTIPAAAPPAATKATPPTGAGGGRATGPQTGPAPQGPAPAGAQPTVQEGVYVYATKGYESTDALGGSRHDYPAESAVTLRATDCGWVQRWQPLAERWDESDLCREGDAIAIRRFSTYHEFFQQGQRQDFTCAPGSHVSRTVPAGQQWGWECAQGSSKVTTTVTFVGTEPFDVGGEKVDAKRFLYESQLSGANRGTQRQERWLHATTGLNLRITTDVDSEVDSPFGVVHYEEHYTISLSSLQPRR